MVGSAFQWRKEKKSCADLKIADLIAGLMPEQDFGSRSPRWSVKPLDLQEMKRVMTRWQIELEGRCCPRVYLTNHHCSKGGTQPFEKFPGFRRAVFSRGNHFRLSRRHRSIQAKYRAKAYAALRCRVAGRVSPRRRQNPL